MFRNEKVSKLFFDWKKLAILLSVIVWLFAHFAGVMYGTHDVPLHTIYIGDEQSPIYGALHVLNEKSPLGLRNEESLYYGPLFALAAIPGVVGDFAYRFAFDGIKSATEYKEFLIYNWGGALVGVRIIAVLVSLLGLFVVFRLLLIKTINPSRNKLYAIIGAGMLGVNFYYFQYSHLFKHWIFIIVAFLFQVLIAVWMHEVRGTVAWHWWLHGIMTVVIFGVSYIGIVHEVAFLPLVYFLWKTEDVSVRKKLYWYFSLVLVGFLSMYWWHPFAFIRYIGFFGVGPMADVIGSRPVTENPLAFGAMSFGYYTKLIILNQLSLVIVGAYLAYYFLRNKVADVWHWAWMLASAGAVNYVLFSLTEHHEGKYMLPTVTFLVVGVIAACIRYLHLENRKKVFTYSAIALVAWYGIFHLVHDIRGIYLWNDGTGDRRLIEQVLTYQNEGIDTPVLIIGSSIVGHAHTPESYKQYVTRFGLEEYDMYEELIKTKPPKGVMSLNARYIDLETFEKTPELKEEYAHILYSYHADWVGHRNEFDYFDDDILKLWYDRGALLPWYTVIK